MLINPNGLIIPFRKSRKHPEEYECRCKNCRPRYTYDHMHCWTIKQCCGCGKKVWYNCEKCSLYSRREYLVCFDCRLPYYKEGLTNGEIYRKIVDRK